MARVVKTALKPGVFKAGNRTVAVTPDRLRKWADTWRRMHAAGIRIPVAWGHTAKALPVDPDERAEHLARHNAGYLDDVLVTDAGELEFAADLPGLTLDEQSGNVVNPVTKSAIGEVSIGVQDWTDGRGRKWEDALVHVALTPHPVWEGQPGFRSAGNEPLQLSLASWLRFGGDYDMADEPEKKGDDGDPDAGAEAAKPEKKPESGDHFGQGMELLKGHGINLPDDTTPENFWERIVVALTALNAAEGTDEGVPSDETAPAPTEAPAPGLALSNVPQVRAMMERFEQQDREKRKERIGRLKKRGLPVFVASRMEKQASELKFSLNADGSPGDAELDRQLDLLEEVMPEGSTLFGVKTRPETIKEALPPEGREKEREKKTIDELSGFLTAHR